MNLSQPTYRLAELCAGYGGLGLGLTQAGISATLEWYAENNNDAAQVLAARTAAPNLGDITTIDNPPPVDIITAGFPCQPVSTAGQQKGIDDERWLIRDVVAVWQRSGARWLLLENVPGLLRANHGEAFGQVLEALSEVGATARWTHLRASSIGAPHQRERWFCLAHTTDQRLERPPGSLLQGRDSRPARGSATHADTDNIRRQSQRSSGLHHRQPGDDSHRRHSERFGAYAQAIHQWEQILGRQAPNPTNQNGKLNPPFVEWMMGLPPGWVTDLDLSRNAQLRVLGNGVVPQQAALAITELTKAAA